LKKEKGGGKHTVASWSDLTRRKKKEKGGGVISQGITELLPLVYDSRHIETRSLFLQMYALPPPPTSPAQELSKVTGKKKRTVRQFAGCTCAKVHKKRQRVRDSSGQVAAGSKEAAEAGVAGAGVAEGGNVPQPKRVVSQTNPGTSSAADSSTSSGTRSTKEGMCLRGCVTTAAAPTHPPTFLFLISPPPPSLGLHPHAIPLGCCECLCGDFITYGQSCMKTPHSNVVKGPVKRRIWYEVSPSYFLFYVYIHYI
jgi:hypothetical protein